MELGSIFLLLAVAVLVGLYLYTPFMARTHRVTEESSNEMSALLAERDRVINSLQELDFDHNLGKIPEDDYPVQRNILLQKGADVLRKLDQLAPASPSEHDAESRIEKAVSARRADGSTHTTPTAELSDDDLESMLAARRNQRKAKSAGFCPKCGKPVLVTDRFCPSCGKSLN
jgi:zinc-ribbon domain